MSFLKNIILNLTDLTENIISDAPIASGIYWLEVSDSIKDGYIGLFLMTRNPQKTTVKKVIDSMGPLRETLQIIENEGTLYLTFNSFPVQQDPNVDLIKEYRIKVL